MTATVHKIHPQKVSRNGNRFIRIEFLIGNKWCKTDVCPDYRNYTRWTDVLKGGVGTVVSGLQWKKKPMEIDADSLVKVIGYPKKDEEPKEKQETLL